MALRKQVSDEVRAWLREKIAADGVNATARSLQVADATLARAAGGLDVQRGTVAQLEAAYQAQKAAA
ncbi:MAG TPA: hypothetical protein VHE30_25915 [Polyangiaceae bacterium]|nr:hypothetical protein [Polyangiaceae bacterium]